MKKDGLSIAAKSLMACEIINSIIDLFLNTFLVAYLLNITNENMGAVAIYYMVDYFITIICMYIIAFFLKKYSISNIYRIGIVFKCLFVVAIVFLKENIQYHLISIALLLGIAETLYWAPCDNIVGYITTNKNRTKYMTNRKIIKSITHILMPILLGTSIELLSFYKVSTYVMILAIVQIFISLLVKVENQNKEKFDLKSFLHSLKENSKINRLKIVYKASILFGVLMNLISTLVTIIIMMTFQTNFQLGALNTIFAICSIVVVFFFKKYSNLRNLKAILTIGSIISVISVISLIINIGKTELIFYYFISSTFIVILEVIYSIERFHNSENGIEEKYYIENQTFINMIMQMGRIVGYGLLLLASYLNHILYFKIVLLLATICIPIYSRYMYQLQKMTNIEN